MAQSQACLLFKDPDFGGPSLTVAANERMSYVGDQWNDVVSSVRVAPGCLLVAFKEPNFAGATETFGVGDFARLPAGWDDQISSVQCNCR